MSVFRLSYRRNHRFLMSHMSYPHLSRWLHLSLWYPVLITLSTCSPMNWIFQPSPRIFQQGKYRVTGQNGNKLLLTQLQNTDGTSQIQVNRSQEVVTILTGKIGSRYRFGRPWIEAIIWLWVGFLDTFWPWCHVINGSIFLSEILEPDSGSRSENLFFWIGNSLG